MFTGVRAYLDDHSAGFTDNEEFTNHVNTFKSILHNIEATENERSKATTGKVRNKAEMRKVATDYGLAVAGAIYSYAKKKGDIQLMESVNLKISDFIKFRDAGLVIELTSIRDTAARFPEDLAKYGITADKFAEFEGKIAQYADALGAKNTGTATKSGARKTMQTMFKEADSILDSIDRLMNEFRIVDPDFYAGYKSARVIKDLGFRHTGGFARNGNTSGEGSAAGNESQNSGISQVSQIIETSPGQGSEL
ncbi:MAG: hypothetical protein IPM96_16775 [Ignavibacteria bacterium]|nr:hypothetical protein [Ignavibacteria bacterium]